MNNDEFRRNLEQRTLDFSVRLLNFIAKLPEKKVLWCVVNQLTKSGTSIGANYREANRAESRSDFVHKIAIVEKESSETVYWLTVLMRVDFIDECFMEELGKLLSEAIEFVKLFTTINKNAKK